MLGAGCGGMATALFAAIEGMKVLLLERTRWVGGTSALAAGAMWIPNTHLAEGSGDTPAKAAHYLQLAAPNGRERLARRFLELGPAGGEVASKRTAKCACALSRTTPTTSPNWRTPPRGAASWNACLSTAASSAPSFALVRPPIPEFTVLGGMMVDRIDIGHLLNLTRSRASFAHSTRLLLRHAGDRLRYRRGARLVMGNALVGRLLPSLRQRGVPVWTETKVLRLVEHDGRVDGVTVLRGGQTLQLHRTARRGAGRRRLQRSSGPARALHPAKR